MVFMNRQVLKSIRKLIRIKAINFLNSLVKELKEKNAALEARIAALESS